MNVLNLLFTEPKQNPNDPKVVAAEIMERINEYKLWFAEQERIHWVFGMPYQWQPLQDTINGVVE